jgi:hypothetical protein
MHQKRYEEDTWNVVAEDIPAAAKRFVAEDAVRRIWRAIVAWTVVRLSVLGLRCAINKDQRDRLVAGSPGLGASTPRSRRKS